MTCEDCGRWIHGAVMVVAVIDHVTYSCRKGTHGMAYESGEVVDATYVVGTGHGKAETA